MVFFTRHVALTETLLHARPIHESRVQYLKSVFQCLVSAALPQKAANKSAKRKKTRALFARSGVLMHEADVHSFVFTSCGFELAYDRERKGRVSRAGHDWEDKGWLSYSSTYICIHTFN